MLACTDAVSSSALGDDSFGVPAGLSPSWAQGNAGDNHVVSKLVLLERLVPFMLKVDR